MRLDVLDLRDIQLLLYIGIVSGTYHGWFHRAVCFIAHLSHRTAHGGVQGLQKGQTAADNSAHGTLSHPDSRTPEGGNSAHGGRVSRQLLQSFFLFHLASHSASSTATRSEPEAAWPSPR